MYHTHVLTFRTFWRQHFSYGRGRPRYHTIRAQRGGRRIELEPLRFYLDLLCYPLSGLHGKKKFQLMGLLGVSQIANAAGFFYESARRVKPERM